VILLSHFELCDRAWKPLDLSGYAYVWPNLDGNGVTSRDLTVVENLK
jgi:hypothetical protein